MGSGNLAFTNHLRDAGASFHAARHEGGAICMADGYARVSGTVTACSVHQGPGLTNAITGLTEAAKSRTPLVLVAADTPAAAIRSNFRIEQDGARARGGGGRRARARPRHGGGRHGARRTARRVERRAVVLMVPLDVQAAEAAGRRAPAAERARRSRRRGPPRRPSPPPPTCCAQAQRPVLIARPRGRAAGRRPRPARARGAHGRAARHLGGGQRVVPGRPVRPRHLRRLRDAARRRAARGGRRRRRVRRRAQPVDDAPRDAGRRRRARRTGRPRRGALGAHLPIARRASSATRRAGRRALDVPSAARRGAAAARAHAATLAAEIARSRWRDARSRRRPRHGLDPRALTIALDDLLPDGAHGRRRLGPLHGLAVDVPARAGRARLRVPAGFQCVGLGLGNAIGAALAGPTG